MSWLYLVLIAVVIGSFTNIFQRVLMTDKKSDPISYTIVFCFILGGLTLIFALFRGFHLPAFGFNLLYFLLSVILWAIGTTLSFKALQLLESSEVTILTSVRALITIFGSIIFLHEFFSIRKSIGTIIILGSIFLVAHLKRGFSFNKGVFFALLSALFCGAAVVVDVINMKGYDPVSYLAVINILIGSVLLVYYPKAIKQWKMFIAPSFLSKMIPLGTFSFAQASMYYTALSFGPTSQIAPINQAQVIITVLLAAVILRERDHLKVKIFASILAVVGIILLR